MRYRRYTEKSEHLKKIQQVEELMLELGVSISVSCNSMNGLVFEVGGKYSTARCESEAVNVFPLELDSRFLVSDMYGNPIEFEDE